MAAAAGCGGSVGTAAQTPRTEDASRPTAFELRRELGNGFRQGLYRLAVMSQAGDDAVDLGQSLPTGTVDVVRCAGRHCTVRWQTVDGDRRATRYIVQPRGGRCFAAVAKPALPQHYDSTIRSYGEHPLNVLVGAC